MSWQSALACWFVRRRLRPETAKPVIDVARARAYAARRVWTPKVPAGWHLTERTDVNDVPLRGEWLTADAEPQQTTILYLHGGGYYFCSPRSHRSVVFALATRANARTFSLDYRLAPEHRFPGALDDAVCGLSSLARRRRSPRSRSSSLAIPPAAVSRSPRCVALRDAGDPLPAGAVLFSPWTDLAATGASIRDVTMAATRCSSGPAIAPRGRRCIWATRDRDASLRVAGLWPTSTACRRFSSRLATRKCLLDDSTRVADKARAAGVIVDFEIWPKMPHVWQLFAPFIPEANRALDARRRLRARRDARNAIGSVSRPVRCRWSDRRARSPDLAVLPLQPAHGEMAVRHLLEVVHEHRVDHRAEHRADRRNRLGGDLFADLHRKARRHRVAGTCSSAVDPWPVKPFVAISVVAFDTDCASAPRMMK